MYSMHPNLVRYIGGCHNIKSSYRHGRVIYQENCNEIMPYYDDDA